MASSSELLLGIDLGTSSVKTVMFDPQGQVLATAVREYPISRPQPGWAEQDAEQWWQATVASLRQVLAQAGGQPAAVGIDSQSSALVAIDESDRPLRPALLWLDRRAQAQCERIKQVTPEEEILQLSGNRLDPSYILPKVLWLREEEPDNYRQARHFLHANGFLIHRLTGEPTTDLTEGGMSLLYDISQGNWSPAILDQFELPAEKFPPLYPPSQVVGEVTASAAEESGLAPGTPVVAGSMDLLAAALGAGVTNAGQSFLVIGTATVLAAAIDRPQPHPDLQLHNHSLPGLWVHAANVDFGAGVLGWLRDVFRQAGAEDLTYEKMAEIAERDCPGPSPVLLLPYMVGQRAPLWDDDCRGVIFGLQPEHRAGHLIRAAIEGNALALGRCLALQEEVRGQPLEELRVTGRQTQLPLVNQIFADVTSRPVLVMDAPEVTCHGAALLASLGVGIYSSPAEIAAALRVKQRYEPRADWHERYAPMCERMAQVYEALRPSFRRLHEEEENL